MSAVPDAGLLLTKKGATVSYAESNIARGLAFIGGHFDDDDREQRR
jgi:hypothetical protein